MPAFHIHSRFSTGVNVGSKAGPSPDKTPPRRIRGRERRSASMPLMGAAGSVLRGHQLPPAAAAPTIVPVRIYPRDIRSAVSGTGLRPSSHLPFQAEARLFGGTRASYSRLRRSTIGQKGGGSRPSRRASRTARWLCQPPPTPTHQAAPAELAVGEREQHLVPALGELEAHLAFVAIALRPGVDQPTGRVGLQDLALSSNGPHSRRTSRA